MTSPPSRLAVLGAMPSELRPLVRPLGLRKAQVGDLQVRLGRLGGAEVVALRTGIGPAEARRTTEQLVASGPFDAVVMIGIAGGLLDDQRIGDLVFADTVMDGATGATFRPTPVPGQAQHGTLHTSHELILDDGRLQALRDDGVVALDMETAAIAAVCDDAGVPWSTIRSISDRPTDGFVDPGILQLTKPDGRPNAPAVIRRLATHPGDIRTLSKLGRDSTTAAKAAAGAFLAAFG